MFRSEFVARTITVFALVTILLAISLLATRGLNFAVEFVGGMIIEARYPEAASAQSITDTLVRTGFGSVSVTEVNPFDFYIVLPTRDADLTLEQAQQLAHRVIAALDTERRHIEVGSVEVVTRRVGRESLLLGVIPLILACTAIMIHSAVRYDWRFALWTNLAHIRNMTSMLGLFLSAYAVFQWEFSMTSLAAMSFVAILIAGVGAVVASRVRLH
ncbi:hypothetical protein JQ621_02010 [Bradyrhizobium manausense]|uniref:hypothetical protein n=1 Tax=Bradyrhizobium manausense TaxID=989370 RepID=UPI001BAC365A|nr:hypothetical protein [Bradyrhizobium manausense]MBR1086245.1 hypothetical protein [Bradyrhizobium manausense]